MRHALLLLVLATAACAVGPDYAPPAPEVPAAWSAPGAGPGTDEALAEWWREFHDPLLSSLVERALADSPDVRIAAARVAEARAGVTFAAGERLPEVGAGAGAFDQRASGNAAPLSQMPPTFTFPRDSDLYRSGFTASWEVDVFGGIARSVEAAEADLAAAEEAARDVRVALAAEVGRQYVELRGLMRQRAVARLNLDAERRTRELVLRRKEAGAASGLDLTRAEAAVAGTQALLPALDSGIARTSHALAVLLGRAPGSLDAELLAEAPVPSPPPAVPAGLPSDLLRRRPDLRRSEREVAAATAREGVATAEMYPRFSLTAALGVASDTLRHFVWPESTTRELGGALAAPLFAGGRLEAGVDAAEARTEAALARYGKAVLIALAEVEGAITACARERERHASLRQAVDQSRRAAEHARNRYRVGESDLLVLLDAQRVQYAAEVQLARSEAALAADTIFLMKALGGGWEGAGR